MELVWHLGHRGSRCSSTAFSEVGTRQEEMAAPPVDGLPMGTWGHGGNAGLGPLPTVPGNAVSADCHEGGRDLLELELCKDSD